MDPTGRDSGRQIRPNIFAGPGWAFPPAATNLGHSMKTAAALLALLFAPVILQAAADPLNLRTNDVVALVGGANSVGASRSGHLESLLVATHPGWSLRVRSLAREGDTVFSQPRELNYPGLVQQLGSIQATVVFLDFGQAESFSGPGGLEDFRTALRERITEFSRIPCRIVLLTPIPISGPDLAPMVAEYAEAVRFVAKEASLPLLDYHAAASRLHHFPKEGRILTPDEQGWLNSEIFQSLFPTLQPPTRGSDGHYLAPDWERLRSAILARNQLWKRWVRPTNWAFLGGDRTEQPSSHDHQNPAIRWFPAEMEEFPPLIRDADRAIDQTAAHLTSLGFAP